MSWKHALLTNVNRLIKPAGFFVSRSRYVIEVGDPPSYKLEPRWEPQGHPALREMIAAKEPLFLETLARIHAHAPKLRDLPLDGDPAGATPYWVNGYLPALDAAALYTLVADAKPARYLEIGSGNSTKFACKAIRDGKLPTQVISIDPYPRAVIDTLCNEAVRQPLETVDLEVFDQLAAGDVLFYDGSHRSFMNSDVTVFFLDILPRLAPGVLVQIHDIYLPFDYIREITTEHYYSEQYLLAAYLLGGAKNADIVLSNYWLTRVDHLSTQREALWDALGLPWKTGQVPTSHLSGGSFWLRTK